MTEKLSPEVEAEALRLANAADDAVKKPVQDRRSHARRPLGTLDRWNEMRDAVAGQVLTRYAISGQSMDRAAFFALARNSENVGLIAAILVLAEMTAKT